MYNKKKNQHNTMETLMQEMYQCQQCSLYIPTSKRNVHYNSRICQQQLLTMYISWKYIYVECPCGVFIQQKNIHSHVQTIRHRECIGYQEVSIFNHPFLQRYRNHSRIPGGDISMVNERVLQSILDGRRFMNQFTNQTPTQISYLSNSSNQTSITSPILTKKQEDYIPNFFMDFIKHMIKNSNTELDCIICYEQINEHNIFILPCFHILCSECQYKLRTKKCPSCRRMY